MKTGRLMTLMIVASLVAAFATGEARFVDREGTLWTAFPSFEGLRLVGSRNGEEITSGLLPVLFAGSLRYDQEISVVADEVTGKVAVVWQREWSETTSAVRIAVWSEDQWENVITLSEEDGRNPRHPAVQLVRVSSATPADPDDPDPDPPVDPVVIRDSFLQVVWWEDGDGFPRARMAVVRLTGDLTDPDSVSIHDLDALSAPGEPCAHGEAEGVMERPRFSTRVPGDRGLVFFGSERTCRLNLVEVTFPLDDPGEGEDPPSEAERRRHRPVFGRRGGFEIPPDIRMAEARVLVDANHQPVIYRVLPDVVEFFIAGENGWSGRRTLALGETGLEESKAVLLIEDLVR